MGKSWASLRFEVYERDRGVCDVCYRSVPFEEFECGHIVDRCAGGQDEAGNLVVMCVTCNRVLKGVHDTREQYDEWKKTDPYSLYMEGMVSVAMEAVGMSGRIPCEHEKASAGADGKPTIVCDC